MFQKDHTALSSVLQKMISNLCKMVERYSQTARLREAKMKLPESKFDG